MNDEMAQKVGVFLERSSIRSLVIEHAKMKKLQLKAHLQGRYIFLKMDACTRMRTNLFAINAQFLNDNGKTMIRTLAIRDTKAQHSSDYIRGIVLEVLNEYNISKKQVLPIVTDNASNMTSTIEKLNDESDDVENMSVTTTAGQENVKDES